MWKFLDRIVMMMTGMKCDAACIQRVDIVEDLFWWDFYLSIDSNNNIFFFFLYPEYVFIEVMQLLIELKNYVRVVNEDCKNSRNRFFCLKKQVFFVRC